MRCFFLLGFLLLTFNRLHAQVGINTTTPDPSSMLDISATDKGMLTPRMTEAQRDAITTPATGLLVYQTDNIDGFWYFDGAAWVNVGDGDTDWIISGNNIYSGVSGNVGIGTSTPQAYLEVGPSPDTRDLISAKAPIVTLNNIADQPNGNDDYLFGPNATVTQTFTPTLTGELVSITLSLRGRNPPTGLVIGCTHDYYVIANGVTSNNTFSISNSSYTYQDVTFTFTGLNVVAGNSYSFILGDNSGSCGLYFEFDNSNPYTGGSLSTGSTNDILFTTVIRESTMEDIFIVQNDGKTGVGTPTPSATLDVVGSMQYTDGNEGAGKVITSDANGNATWQNVPNTGEFQSINGIVQNTTDVVNDNFVFGSTSLNNIAGVNDDIKMFFDKSSGAFRAGKTSGTEWDEDNRGDYSFASGYASVASAFGAISIGVINSSTAYGATSLGTTNCASGSASLATGQLTKASGEFSFTSGLETEASGDHSVALGWATTSSGGFSFASGESTIASGHHAVAMGYRTVASGPNSVALGKNTVAPSLGETVVGIRSTLYTPASISTWSALDRIFVVGNGDSSPSNALTILKNGNSGFGDDTPEATLDVHGTMQFIDGNEAPNKVLTSDAAGFATWQDLPAQTNDADWVISGANQYSAVSGNVGIGTTSPSVKLDIRGANAGLQTIQSTTAGNGSFTQWYNGDGTVRGIIGADGTGLSSTANQFTIGTWTNHPIDIRTNTSSRLHITNTGNVGINTTTPSKMLTIQSNEPVQYRDAGGTDQWHLKLQGTGNSDLGFTETGVADNRFVLAAGGSVGVGTATPTQAKFVVNGTSSSDPGLGSYYALNGSGGPLAFGVQPYSIYASGRVAASEFNAFSDARIKNIKGISNSEKDLETLAKIEITNYQLKDTIAKGTQTFKKVIAQQVAAVYPQAVSDNLTDVIPNIYQLSEINNGVITLSTNLTVGDKVKLIFSEGEELVDVTEVTKNSFKVATTKQGKVFVFGKQVDNLHTVDYEAISMLNVSATQALLKRIEMLEQEKISLKAEVSVLKEKQQTTDNRLQKIEQALYNEVAKK